MTGFCRGNYDEELPESKLDELYVCSVGRRWGLLVHALVHAKYLSMKQTFCLRLRRRKRVSPIKVKEDASE